MRKDILKNQTSALNQYVHKIIIYKWLIRLQSYVNTFANYTHIFAFTNQIMASIA